MISLTQAELKFINPLTPSYLATNAVSRKKVPKSNNMYFFPIGILLERFLLSSIDTSSLENIKQAVWEIVEEEKGLRATADKRNIPK